MTIKSLYPSIRPKLNLNFARAKALDPRITFTRASTGTYVGADGLIKTAASNAARFDHDPSTGESLGLLVEEARTNLLTYSEQFDNAAWSKADATITANSTVAPDGTTTADALIENTANASHNIRTIDFGGSINTAYSFSVFVKAAGRTFVSLVYGQSTAWGNQQARFNLALGTIAYQTGVNSASIKAYPNGWYQISITGTRNATAAASYAYIFVQNGDNYNSYTGDGISGVYIWGAQVEAGAFPTSYIPTVASTVTRAADVASIGASNFNAFNSTFVFTGFAATYSGGNVRHAEFGGSNGENRLLTNGDSYAYGPGGSLMGPNPVIDSNKIASNYAFAFKYDGSTTIKAYAKNGGATSSVSNSGQCVPSDPSLTFGATGSSANTAKTFKHIAYWPTKLSDAQLQALTS